MTGESVIVALSGGVDSSVAAALLVDQGFSVQGVYLKFASEVAQQSVETRRCSWEEDFDFVRRVGEHLKIPIRSFNVERAYASSVIEPMVRTYASGRTPNPDVLCNQKIKFGTFAEWTKGLGAGWISTGHYARIDRTGHGIRLKTGVDREKDQSYFLAAIPRAILKTVLFPVGSLTKQEVRSIARQRGLPTADRPDSQGICFLGPVRLSDFLRSRTRMKPGLIVDSSGSIVGRHNGIAQYTVGQRHGLGIGSNKPLYIAAIDAIQNTLLVANGRNDPVLFSTSCTTSAIHWLTPSEERPQRCSVRTRYRQPVIPATIVQDRESNRFLFESPQRAVAPGQTIVLYSGDTVLGSATIESTDAPIPPVMLFHHPMVTT